MHMHHSIIVSLIKSLTIPTVEERVLVKKLKKCIWLKKIINSRFTGPKLFWNPIICLKGKAPSLTQWIYVLKIIDLIATPFHLIKGKVSQSTPQAWKNANTISSYYLQINKQPVNILSDNSYRGICILLFLAKNK